MRCAYIQFAPRLADVKQTILDLQRLWPEVAGADLVVLPELANSGYNFVSMDQAVAAAEDPAKSVFIDALTDACSEHGFHIVTGFNERTSAGLYNTALLVGRSGVMGRYRKLHLFLREKDFFFPGDVGLPVFEVGGVKIGMLVCFDWAFPEVWRGLVLQGAEIICHPSNLVLPGLAQRAIPAYSLTNRVFIITANRIGTEGNLTFTGMSIATNTLGQVISMAPHGEPVCAVFDVDPKEAQNKQVTCRNHLIQDRRPDVYSRYLP